MTFHSGANEGETISIDAVYIAIRGSNGQTTEASSTIREDASRWRVRLGYLNGEMWNDGAGYNGNEFGATSFAGTTTERNQVQTLFSHDILDYDDVSSNFPDSL